MTTKSTISYIIAGKEGSTVAEQFECTWHRDEAFEDQNGNALRIIERVCSDLLESNILSDRAHFQVDTYLLDLREYLDTEK